MINPRDILRSSLRRLGVSGPARGRAFQGSGASLAGVLAVLALLALPAANAAATGDANAASCPFETESSPGFRAFLPDCRAYELVSPPYAGGGVPTVEDISPNGEHVIVASGGGFAGVESLEQSGDYTKGHYELSRTATGWTAEALDPPASLFPRHSIVFPSTDLNRILYFVAPGHAGEEFFEASHPGYNGYALAVGEYSGNGSPRFTLVGPEIAPGHEECGESRPCVNRHDFTVVGASGDLGHIFLLVGSAERQLWPGDGTAEGGQSLYEYRLAEGREPVLVGVANSGSLSGSPHVNEGAQLESDCGTAFDASSESGETVIFTALHVEGCSAPQPAYNEIYARLRGSETVKVSGAGAAVFRGASDDGAKVFFTEGEDLYMYDVEDRQARLLASKVAGVQTVSRDGFRVYFTSPDELTSGAKNGNGEKASEVPGEKLYVVDTEGGGPPTFVAGEPGLDDEARGLRAAEASGDGEFLVFATARNLLGTNDTSTVAQLFEYDATTGMVSRVSAGEKSATGFYCAATGTREAGYDCDGNTSEITNRPSFALPRYGDNNGAASGFVGKASAPGEEAHDLSVANDGVVVFRSSLALTPQAVPGRDYLQGKSTENVYEYRAGQTYLISTGDEAAPLEPSAFPRVSGVDESGMDIFLLTPDSLVPQDTDTQGSVYDARESGGFPAPAVPQACSGERCQGTAPAAPAFAAPGSNTLTGSGDLTPPVETKPGVKAPVKPKAKRCKKGYVKKKNKCVKRLERRKPATTGGQSNEHH